MDAGHILSRGPKDGSRASVQIQPHHRSQAEANREFIERGGFLVKMMRRAEFERIYGPPPAETSAT